MVAHLGAHNEYAYQELITMNMDKVQVYIDKVTSSLPNPFAVITQNENLHILPFSMNDLAVPYTGSMTVGITVGFMRG
jgi:hypothetical protein